MANADLSVYPIAATTAMPATPSKPDYRLPPELLASTGVSLSPSIQRYQEARDTYLRRRIQRLFLSDLSSYDKDDAQKSPAPLKERHAAAQSQVVSTSNSLNSRILNLQHKYELFCNRRQELKRMFQEAHDKFAEDEEEVDENQQVVNDEQLAEGEQRLAALKHRRLHLEHQLRRVQGETRAVLAAKAQHQTQLAPRGGPPRTGDLLQSQVQQLEDMTKWYKAFLSVLEELGGLAIDKIEANGPKGLLLTVHILQQHTVQFELQPRRGSEMRLEKATLVSSSRMVAPNDEGVVLTIPPLDDLVELAAPFGPAEDLRYVLRETATRLRALQARVTELALLRQAFLTKILDTSKPQHGGYTQQVLCSLNEGITVVLNLERDCPLLPGTVQLEQVAGFGQWESAQLQDLQNKLNQQRFASPLQLMQTFTESLAQFGVKPNTPVLPKRAQD